MIRHLYADDGRTITITAYDTTTGATIRVSMTGFTRDGFKESAADRIAAWKEIRTRAAEYAQELHQSMEAHSARGSATIRLVGGPCDGKELAVPVDEHGMPPRIWHANEFPILIEILRCDPGGTPDIQAQPGIYDYECPIGPGEDMTWEYTLPGRRSWA